MVQALLKQQPDSSDGADDKTQLVKVISRRFDALADNSASSMKFIDILIPKIAIYLADAAKVDRLNEDERMAGIWLAISTLFLGVWLQNWLEASDASFIVLMVAGAFAAAAAYQYVRAKKALQEMHNTRFYPLNREDMAQDKTQEQKNETEE